MAIESGKSQMRRPPPSFSVREAAIAAGVPAMIVDQMMTEGLVISEDPRMTIRMRIINERQQIERAAAVDALSTMRGSSIDQLGAMGKAFSALTQSWSVWEQRGELATAAHFRAAIASLDAADALIRMFQQAREQLAAENRLAADQLADQNERDYRADA